MPQQVVGQVEALWRFPVKSMLGERVDQATLTPQGIVGDRRFAVQDRDDATIATARSPRSWPNILELSARYLTEPAAGKGAEVLIGFPDGGSVRSDDADVDRRLSEFLGRDVRLIREVPEKYVLEYSEFADAAGGARPDGDVTEGFTAPIDVEMHMAARIVGADDALSTFVDLAPVHLLTTATLRTLRAANPSADFEPVRFRPNILADVAGEGFVESGWLQRGVRIGEVSLRPNLHCSRCIVPTHAHGDLPIDRSHLRTIVKLNRLRMGNVGSYGCAGVYAECLVAGTVRVGDPVSVAAASA